MLRKVLYRFLQKKSGMGVVEIIIIIAVLVSIALFFRSEIFSFVGRITTKAFPQDIEQKLGDEGPVRSDKATAPK